MYGLITYVRNVLFDKGILKTQHHNIPILSVGNLKAGGTGKTPFVEYLLRTFSSSFNIAVVSRGYGRKTKGFFVVNFIFAFRKEGTCTMKKNKIK